MALTILHYECLARMIILFTTIVVGAFFIKPLIQPETKKSDNEALSIKEHLIIKRFSSNISSQLDKLETSNFISKVDKCVVLQNRPTNITTGNQYGKFDFKPEWIKRKMYWDSSFDVKYEKVKSEPNRPPLKVILVPHSHNDPGWLSTFTTYFETDTRQIINLMVIKLQEYKDMTFIWTEISFLQLWWDQANSREQLALKQLVKSGRLEITTGGWVMSDEANVHIYAMVDQLIEGHQWVKANLNVTPRVGWSIDPFGHGSTVPYLLAASQFHGAIIQRIHYAWKRWFAEKQAGDFLWTPYWSDSDTESMYSLHTHNMPFDIYSTSSSCGPQTSICTGFDFIYSFMSITDENVEANADILLEQYSKTASLFPHNVALVLIGDDFRYNREEEFDQQYTNYKKLIDFINGHQEKYNTEINFGTPSDYFRAIKRRTKNFPTLKGDFFVYSDIFTDGSPAYWSGYFTTRPSYKLLCRVLENNLRNAEILFTVAISLARQKNHADALRRFENNYENMISARRNLGLFQHHDAITGTSKQFVMHDYGKRLFDGIQKSVKIQESTIEFLLQKEKKCHNNFVLSEMKRENFTKIPTKRPINPTENKSVNFVIFNSLLNEKHEVILIRSLTSKLQILNSSGNSLEIQVNPVWNLIGPNLVSNKQFEIIFLAKLKPLSLNVFTAVYDDSADPNRLATIYCNGNCRSNTFIVWDQKESDVQIENSRMRLHFNGKNGFLKSVTEKDTEKKTQCKIKFSLYRGTAYQSGAYLFKANLGRYGAEEDPVVRCKNVIIIITTGPLASDVTVIYGPFLAHTVRLFNTKDDLERAIFIENNIDLAQQPTNSGTDLFMRFITEIKNGADVPEIYTDLNGFQYLPRRKVPTIGIEGNYFPITSGAFIQDEQQRLTILTTHAQGAASLNRGELEVMLDRRSFYDDGRGMGEAITDSKLTTHRFWILFETFKGHTPKANEYQMPSLLSNHLSNILNYPSSIYFVENQKNDSKVELHKQLQLVSYNFPCDVHLINLRTVTKSNRPLFPSKSALMVLHRQGYNCKLSSTSNISKRCYNIQKVNNRLFTQLDTKQIYATSLTGLNHSDGIKKMSDINVKPMEIKTFKIQFI